MLVEGDRQGSMLRAVLAGGSVAAMPLVASVYAAEKPVNKPGESITDKVKSEPPAEIKSPKPKPEAVETDNTILVSQLPLYGSPAAPELVYVPEKVGMIQENIVPVREVLLTAINKCQKFIDLASKTQAVTSATLKDFVRYLREDSGAVPRGAFITVSGLGGLVAGYRGGVFRKLLYMSVGMTGSAAVCYPSQAIDISQQAWVLTRDQARELWNQGKAGDDKAASKQAETKTDTKPEPDTKPSDDKDSVKVVDKPDQTSGDVKPKEDHGQSTPDDKAMYSTRS